VQRDMTRVAEFVNIMRLQRIEVGRRLNRSRSATRRIPWARTSSSATNPTVVSPRTSSRSSSIPTHALTTYDDSGWSTGYAMNVDCRGDRRLDDPQAKVTPVDKVVP
jgi:hypothetical protein